ncbi:hypothetical protein [Alloactinosynnema sp. L-07]|uniref:hypothetical protein n=1 Tax=Alloactinosynnema sp. L-07 TaxID=1653480 RepID=UPI00065EFCF4|nr:hypothetical protein [Alloactinosynnema sp. L-07]CRK56727.1 hypothetical protein [Alloactinosynnema sp. L-07]
MVVSRLVKVGVGIVAGAMLVVLAPAAAATTTVPVSASGSIQAPVPALPPASLTLTVGDRSVSASVPGTAAGQLSVVFSANTAATVDVDVDSCASPASGVVLTVRGLSEGATVSASVTSSLTPPVTVGDSVVGADRTVVASLCTT